jgi:hypothetical protein|tara:strand:+ start:257 stop:457 length:201 start_codon:yes stop_codon:yes gene_type:complete
MYISKHSMLTGDEHTMDLNVTPRQIKAWQEGTLIQNAMPNLTSVEREFIMTGITKNEWDNLMGEDA